MIMKEYELSGNEKILKRILNSIKSEIYFNFSVDLPRSIDMAKNTFTSVKNVASLISVINNCPIAYISLDIKNKKLIIRNIIPKNPGILTETQYNRIFDVFYEEVIKSNQDYINNISSLKEKITN